MLASPSIPRAQSDSDMQVWHVCSKCDSCSGGSHRAAFPEGFTRVTGLRISQRPKAELRCVLPPAVAYPELGRGMTLQQPALLEALCMAP